MNEYLNTEDVVLQVLDTEAPSIAPEAEGEEVFISEDTADHVA